MKLCESTQEKSKIIEEKRRGRRRNKGRCKSLNWLWKILPSKQKSEYGYPNSTQCFYTKRQWLKFGTRETALIPRQALNPSQQKLSYGPNLAHHQVLYICELKMVFYIFKQLPKKINRIFHGMWKLCEIQIAVSINKVIYWNMESLIRNTNQLHISNLTVLI